MNAYNRKGQVTDTEYVVQILYGWFFQNVRLRNSFKSYFGNMGGRFCHTVIWPWCLKKNVEYFKLRALGTEKFEVPKFRLISQATARQD